MTHMSIIRSCLQVLLVVFGSFTIQQPAGNPVIPSPAPTARITETGRVLVPEPSERAIHYHQSGNVLWLIFTAWGLLFPALILVSGLSAQMRNLARRIGRKWFFTIELYVVLFVVLSFLVDLPVEYYRGYVRQHAYGLSNQTLGKWFQDTILSYAVLLTMGCLVVWIPYLLLKKSPKRWWLYMAILAVPLLFAGMLVSPIWIAPLFNDFGEMKNKELEDKILALADRAGIEEGRVYEVNKSVDTKAVNAYVVGLFGTKRIVLWDTLLEKLPEKEVLFIMGHEMGHYVLGHLVQGILVTAALILVTLFLVHLASGTILRRFAGRFRFEQLSDIASMPLLLLLVNFFSLFVMPLGMAFSRHIEHEADRFGLEITRDNQAAAMSFVKLQKENLGVPRPGWVYWFWRGSHPSAGERIDFANDYRPWEDGKPLKYGHLFRVSTK
jgi:STE24 endopeptidase